MKLFAFLILLLQAPVCLFAQSVGINATGTPADPSAMLDITSTNKGLLIPRMTKAEKLAIPAPATGLMVYQSGPDSTGFHYFNGTSWMWIGTAAASVGWNITGNAGTTLADNFFGTTDDVPLSFRMNNSMIGRWNRNTHNYFLGDSAGAKITTGTNNIGMGSRALFENTVASSNVAIGVGAFQNNVGSWRNVVIGDSAHYTHSFPTAGFLTDNTAIGSKAMFYNQPTSTGNGAKNTAVGSEAMYLNTTGYVNTAVGVSALRENTTGAGNTAIGRSAHRRSKSGLLNSYLGFESGYNDSISSGNTGMGGYVLGLHGSGNYNSAFGHEALQNDSVGTLNSAMGWRALRNNKTGSLNTAIGVGALEHNSTGNYNVAVGRSASFQNDTASFVTAIGLEALTYNKKSYTTAVGAYAGFGNGYLSTTPMQGAENTIMGYAAMTNNMFGSQNVAVGYRAMGFGEIGYVWSISPSRNVAVGDSALFGNVGHDNVAVGYRALRLNNNGGGSIAIGSRALNAYTATYPSTAIGYLSQDSTTTGYANTSLGSYTMSSVKTGYNNTAIGNAAMYEAGSNAIDNTALGNDALRRNRRYGNVAVGAGALPWDTSGVYNTGVGFLSMQWNRNGSVNTALGVSSLRFNVSGSYNVAIGGNSMMYRTRGTHNTAVGYESMITDSSGVHNTAVGWRSMRYNIGGNDNTAIGVGALEFQDSISRNTAVGRGAMIGNPGYKNSMEMVAVGFYAGALSDTAQRGVIIGAQAGYYAKGNDNVLVGYRAGIGNGNFIGTQNVGIGNQTLNFAYTANSNVMTGYQSGYAISQGSGNVGVGTKALRATNIGSFNVAVGDSALYINSTGNYNTALGARTATLSSNLENATAIGYGAAVAVSNAMVLGSIRGINNASNNIRVGIGTQSPLTKMHIYHNDPEAVSLRIASLSSTYEPGLELVKTTSSGSDWKLRVTPAGNMMIGRGGDDFLSAVIDEYEFTLSTFRPAADNVNSLGGSGFRWTAVWAANGLIQTSDEREKEDINDLNYGLNEIMQLRPVSFRWKNNPALGNRIGFIAQEVEPVLKEAVVKGDLPGTEQLIGDDGVPEKQSDKMGVIYSDIIPVAVKAIQEQQKQIADLKAENEALRQEIQQIKQKLEL